ncbi:MAG: secondary thiamine-phosphate synthase enzyme YjbQ [Proteobacteria bacterium]|nr:secondary thiamine-phosphate synthase enzyme YjbQ [Pseudomonadota bacterium]
MWMSKTKYLTFNTKKEREIIRITDQVEEFRRESGLYDGMILVSAMHITAGVIVNDWEEGLHQDIMDWLEKVAPRGNYHHHRTGEINGDAHLKNLTVGHQVIVPVTNGELDLGPWQQIFYAEFDGRRSKRVLMKAIGLELPDK